MKKPVRPPASERVLTRYVTAFARRNDTDVVRVRRLISFMALAGALRQATRAEEGTPAFVVKGGVALELRMQDRARATRDLDLILNRDLDDPLMALEELLTAPYEGFTFRRKGEEYRMPNGAVRVKVQVSFQGREWGTVEVDLAHREGETEVELVPGVPLLEEFGIVGPDEIECLSLRHHVAQKLHAVTRPMPDGRPNDRFRDLIDLLLLRQFVHDKPRSRPPAPRCSPGAGRTPGRPSSIRRTSGACRSRAWRTKPGSPSARSTPPSPRSPPGSRRLPAPVPPDRPARHLPRLSWPRFTPQPAARFPFTPHPARNRILCGCIHLNTFARCSV